MCIPGCRLFIASINCCRVVHRATLCTLTIVIGIMSSKKAKASTKFLALADILHDLAVLRATEVEISKSNDTQTDSSTPVAVSVASSYEYTRAARNMIRLHDSNKVEREGARIDDLRSKLEDLLEELDAGN